MQGIEVTVNKVGAKGNIAFVKVKGYVDTTTSAELYGVLANLLNTGMYQYVVDMGGVNYISSAGWGVFVGEIRGIREQGGDLKIVQMTPDVYEVFAMLEFNKILEYYETVEEAINDFDISMGLDITRSSERKPIQIKKDDVTIASPHLKHIDRKTDKEKDRRLKKWSNSVKPKVNEAQLPLVEKIKTIIIDDPNRSMHEIKRELNTGRFGNQKVGYLKLRSILKEYNLETKELRYRFYRSR